VTDGVGFDVVFNPSGSRDFLDLPRVIRRRIRRRIISVSRDPRAEPAMLMLGEWEGYWRLRVGEYRMIYEVDDRAPPAIARRRGEGLRTGGGLDHRRHG
jgi:mRNA interferase RelE/StbE